jgi:hypothetical protein
MADAKRQSAAAGKPATPKSSTSASPPSSSGAADVETLSKAIGAR